MAGNRLGPVSWGVPGGEAVGDGGDVGTDAELALEDGEVAVDGAGVDVDAPGDLLGGETAGVEEEELAMRLRRARRFCLTNAAFAGRLGP